ncbi:MAG: bifunctional diaminohydroxyphosphoribosylaminopyrimidine deaminase/5-amino-6-(5-phosphoribosylamino)uracil reductase RibD [Alphaproteobacteria bacterium]|nr:bifunctional diaminohydroxyphosphoribosylaminopyrimidine deaminase/5-amino-6-(5-phosphoribosylamino)uracil reductase RibD [Alphaproteobacteria bacterium]
MKYLSKRVLSSAMRRAADEARGWIGATSPNPPVGAVALDREGQILAVAAHKREKTPHAEAALIEICREKGVLDRVHTLCVTLEPCNHHGHNPPCTEAILRSGIKNIAVGTRDPNPFVVGGGLERLQAEGINVTCGIEESLCLQLIYAFSYSMKTGIPWITIKRAFNPDGSMIPEDGQKTFTSPSSLLLAHKLRKRADAILTGSETILSDNPLFTVRLISDYPGKRRFLAILDRRRRVPQSYLEAAKERGLDPIVYDDIKTAQEDLFKLGVREILVEAGPSLSQSALDAGFWNMLVDIERVAENSTDKIKTALNSDLFIPFDPANWRIENMITSENKIECETK